MASNTAGLQVNSNGSVDLDFGPAPPDGQQTNWIPTKADGRFEALCRLYGPQQPFFDKIWKLPDIQRCLLYTSPSPRDS